MPLAAVKNPQLTPRRFDIPWRKPDATCVLNLAMQDQPISTPVIDRSGNANNGAITGATWQKLPSGLWVMNFDGIDDYLTVTNAASLDITGAISIIAWVNRDVDTKYMLPAAKAGGTGIQYNFYWAVKPLSGDDNKLHLAGLASGMKIGTNIHAQTGSWHLIAVTYDVVNVVFYFDGVADGSTADNTAFTSRAENVYVGQDNGGSFTDGKIFNPRIFNRALSAGEISNYYQQTRGYFGV